jgi:iron complex transport system ATP-binding protein
MDGCTRQRDHDAVADVLRRIGMEDFAMRSTDELSGGELQKVVLGRALAQGPRVMLLDEPISHLDPVNQIEVMSLLHEATRNLEMVSLLVTHDLNQALRFADRFVMLRSGGIFAAGGRDVITPGSIREVYGIETTVEEVKGTAVIVPILPAGERGDRILRSSDGDG